ncbi:hypothetical protein [Streptomyces corynorhini]|uniref:hypothetical protein n=1 Tax=Streptomyces corynorhini TaxID=2282652 RepID=UPI001F3AB104|nr:hypothetical protein [Streptomyces corynorhini]
MTVPVRGVVPALTLTATATLTPAITDAAGSTTALDPVVATARGWAVPWAALLALALLAAAVVTAAVRRRRRRARSAEREAARVRDAVERALRDQEASAR